LLSSCDRLRTPTTIPIVSDSSQIE
jgi:hypothetical protein